MTSRELILKEFKANPYLDVHEIALKYNMHSNYVNRFVKEFRSIFESFCELWLVKSLSENDVYYLFTSFGAEKKLKIKNNKILNTNILTDYEKTWLEVNLRYY